MKKGQGNNTDTGKRNFLKIGLLAGGAVMLLGALPKRIFGKKDDKVKMLTADGKLVWVDRSILEKAKSQKINTAADVRKWMDANKK